MSTGRLLEEEKINNKPYRAPNKESCKTKGAIVTISLRKYYTTKQLRRINKIRKTVHLDDRFAKKAPSTRGEYNHEFLSIYNRSHEYSIQIRSVSLNLVDRETR